MGEEMKLFNLEQRTKLDRTEGTIKGVDMVWRTDAIQGTCAKTTFVMYGREETRYFSDCPLRIDAGEHVVFFHDKLQKDVDLRCYQVKGFYVIEYIDKNCEKFKEKYRACEQGYAFLDSAADLPPEPEGHR